MQKYSSDRGKHCHYYTSATAWHSRATSYIVVTGLAPVMSLRIESRERIMATTTAEGQVFIGPGLSRFKQGATIGGVLAVTALVLWIAIHQGVSAVGSTIAAVVFIFGFVLYLRIVAPVPFTISLEPQALTKRSRNGEEIVLSWADLTRIKEEFFPNGKRISITVYRNVTEPTQKPKAWAVYRDDVTNLDGLATALKQAIPETCQWQSETVHE